MKRIVAGLICTLMLLLLCGCSIYTESESRYIVSFIGFDGGDEVKATIEAVSGVGINGEESESFIFNSSGKSADEAVYNLGAKLSKPLSFDHCAVVAVGNSLNSKQLEGVFDYCEKNEEFNLACYFAAAENTTELAKGEKNITAALGYDIVGLIEHTARYSGVTYGNRFYEIRAKLKRKQPFFSLPLISPEENGAVILGEKFYKDNRCILNLSFEESQIYALLCNSFSGGRVDISGDLTVIKKAHTSFKIENENPIKINLKSKITGDVDKEFLSRYKAGASGIIERAKKSEAGDIFGFADNIFRRNETLWKELSQNYEAAFADGIFEVSVVE